MPPTRFTTTDITDMIVNAVKPNPNKSPKKRNMFHDHIVYFTHEMIKGSDNYQTISRWHWVIMENIKAACEIKGGTAESEELEKNVVALAEAIWNKYYTGNGRAAPRKKRTLSQLYEDEEDDGNCGEVPKMAGAKKAPSIIEMAQTGVGFKLDWDDQGTSVRPFKLPDEDVMMSDEPELEVDEGGKKEKQQLEESTFDEKENRRPISSPSSIVKKLMRKRLLEKLELASG
ncbi:hypothetical protein TWF730_008498 [Orbilia blumenaviensis]|uniref:Uncharacterized protein n=1 Tax=Orbilia blumenaviensis TaxID=1796055 RepID=A0AAV9V5I2_9PEZI